MLPLLALAAAPAIYQGVSGILQKRKANRINAVRPTYNIPGAVHESVDMARQSANAAMPGYGTAQNNIKGATANAVRSAQLAGSGNSMLAAIAAAQSNESNSLLNLATQSAQHQAAQRQNLQGSLMNLAQYKDKAWDWNEKQKYQEKAAAKAALTEAANQNINGAISGLASIGTTALGQKKKQMPGMPLIPGMDMQNALITSPNPYGTYNGNPLA
ncbi:hypothetical protein [Pontibacter actiniarum]|uniref:Uncharacterized protein n=1 Tax=Pontibacter actiniarum TaxID=323450 RepID=A0A1X9YV98_9BACT|nr:hypothetical protein [Pontibacter actiniarum]ARS36815.1 hypothetical protein CA264_16065 [Pontibacter actiniarum]